MSDATETPEMDCDIIVAILAHFHCQFQGRADQLRREGLLPSDLALPPGRKALEWANDAWRFRLVRVRAPGSTALFAEWKHHDWWRLLRWRVGAAIPSISDTRALECRDELKRIQWALSPAGVRQARMSESAKRDAALQSFLKGLRGGIR